MQPLDTGSLVAELADREAIRDCLMRYARGVDRRDADLLRTVYWPGAQDHHGPIDAPAEEFIVSAIAAVKAMEQTMHSISNVLIRLRGNAAAVESYFTAYHRLMDEGELRDVHLGGRYLDRMEKRGGEWRIAERHVIYDWYGKAASLSFKAGAFGIDFQTNQHPDDASYGIFARLDGDS